MRIKKYVAPTLPEALARIKQDMGQDAVILKTLFTGGPKDPGVKAVEVTAAIDNAANIQDPPDRFSMPPQQTCRVQYDADNSDNAGITEPAQISVELQSELRAIRNEIARIKIESSSNGLSESQSEIEHHLIDCGVPGLLARETAAKVPGGAFNESELLSAWKDVIGRLSKYLEPGAPTKLHKGKATVILLFGATGSGKTSAAARIAYQYIYEKNMPVTLISTDTFRADSNAQFTAMAQVLGCRSIFSSSAQDLSAALGTIKEGLAVIDTSGISDVRDLEHIQALISASNPHEIHFVVPADTSFADLKRIISAEPGLTIDKLLITKLDQSDCRGGIIAASQRFNLKFSYQCSSREIPGLFDLFNPQAFVASLIPEISPDNKPEASLEVVGW